MDGIDSLDGFKNADADFRRVCAADVLNPGDGIERLSDGTERRRPSFRRRECLPQLLNESKPHEDANFRDAAKEADMVKCMTCTKTEKEPEP